MNVHSSGHEKFIRSAIEKARKKDEKGRRTPFGAVIVRDDKIIASANNSVAGDHDPTAHAEVNAIRKACKKIKSNDLSGSVIYTTCEPCPMCFSAIWWAKISQIVFGVGIAELLNHGWSFKASIAMTYTHHISYLFKSK